MLNPRARRTLVGAAIIVAVIAPVLYYVHATTSLFAPLPPPELDAFNVSNLAVNPRRALVAPREKGFFHALVTDRAATQPPLAKTAPVNDAAFLADDAPIVGVTLNGESRAYPLAILSIHQAVNDQLGGVLIAVFHCPLSNAVSVVDRRIDGQTLQFAVSGLLLNSNLILHDLTHDALWSQVRLTALSGPFSGRSLPHLAGWSITTFDHWRTAHPDSTILTFDTGHDRPYGRTDLMYESYHLNADLWFPIEPRDHRLPPKTRVVGIRTPDAAHAWTLDAIARAGGALRHTIDGRRIAIEADHDASTLTILEAPPDCQVVHTYWFAWYAFHPSTTLTQ